MLAELVTRITGTEARFQQLGMLVRLEMAAIECGATQRQLINSHQSNDEDVRRAIRVHVAIATADNNLTMQQRARLFDAAHRQAGVAFAGE